MRAVVDGEFVAFEKWTMGEKTGWTLTLLQERSTVNIGVTNEQSAQVPDLKRLDRVQVAVDVQRGYEGRGFKARFAEFVSPRAKAAVSAV